MKRVIFNQKGGVGKSSITANLAAISAARGFKTLVIDLDAQANCSQYLLGDFPEHPKQNIAAFFEQFLQFRLLLDNPNDFIFESAHENLSLIPASHRLAELQAKLEMKHKIYKLREALAKYTKAFDHIYIDTPPALNFYTLSALIAADCCLIPFDCDQFSRRALDVLMENVAEIRADHNPNLKVEGIVVNQFVSSANAPREIVEELKADGLPVLKTMLPSSVKMKESHRASQPLIHFAPKHKLTQSYEALHDELNRS